MKRTVAFAIVLALSACGGEGVTAPDKQTAAAPETQVSEAPPQSVACTGEEVTIFSCDTVTGEQISVCSGGGDTATYRFGSDQPEIEIEGGQWARVGYSGGGELQIAFDNGDTRYVVFGRTVRTNFAAGQANEPASSDGVVVLRNGEYESLQLCSADSDNSYYGEESEGAMQRLPQSEELFTDQTGRADRL